jgi:1-acyl-sn-glycerol-3-phosphate acyltransferase
LPAPTALGISFIVARNDEIPEESVRNRHPVVLNARRVAGFYVRGYHRFGLLTPVTLPKHGKAILVCNHISGLDPVLLQTVTPRLLTWMVAREYRDQLALKWLFDAIQAIPVERSGRDLAATRSALRMLESGYVIGLFPEGRIADRGDVLPFRIGVALLAIRSGAPVIPAYIEGTMYGQEMIDAYLYPQRARLAFGPPVEFDRSSSEKRALEAATEHIHAAVLALRDRYFAPQVRAAS